MKASLRRGAFTSLCLAAMLASSGCQSAPPGPKGERHYRTGQDQVFEYTGKFVQNPRGGWEPSPKPGPILAVSTPYLQLSRKGGEAPHPMNEQSSGDGAPQSAMQLIGFQWSGVVSYVIVEGTSPGLGGAVSCEFGGGDTGSYRYITGSAWPRQRKHWVDATCDATTVIMQEIVHSDTTLTDRVYLLWDGQPSQATVWIINSGEHRTLTCNQPADECYVETNDGLTFTTANPILLHPGDSTSSAAALFVECVRGYANATGITQAVRAILTTDGWLRSGQKRP